MLGQHLARHAAALTQLAHASPEITQESGFLAGDVDTGFDSRVGGDDQAVFGG